ncbi:hypothetical protein AAG906_031106 [Vitis piasezkii]
MKQAMKKSCRIFEEGRQEHQKGGSSSQPSNKSIKKLKQVQASKVPLDTKLEIHIWKRRCKSLRTRKLIINFMIYCDRRMIYHSSVDTTNIPKTIDYIISLMDKVVEDVGEENVVQVVTDNKANLKQPYWEVIDRRWECQLHRHLHVAGEFGSALTKKAINQSFPSEWWNNYGDEGPHLQKIVVKILSQTCSSSGCERNWSTWLLIHTKLQTAWQLRIKNLMQERNNEDLYNPIDLNHIFNDDDILDEWIREGEKPILSSDNLDWLDKDLPTNEEGRETVHEDDGATNRRVSRRTSNATQERDVDYRHKSGWWRVGARGVGGTDEGTGGDVDPGMSWAQGGENYYATQDTYHGYRLGIWEQRKHLERLTTFPNDDDYSSGDIQILEHELVIHMDMINLLVAVALVIEVLDTINMVLIPNSLRNHIFLIMDHQANHLSQHIQVMNNSFNHILTMGIATQICILVIGLMMMIFEPPHHSTWN